MRAVEYGNELNVGRGGARWRIFGSVTQRLVRGIQAIWRFIRSAAGIVATWSNLLAGI